MGSASEDGDRGATPSPAFDTQVASSSSNTVEPARAPPAPASVDDASGRRISETNDPNLPKGQDAEGGDGARIEGPTDDSPPSTSSPRGVLEMIRPVLLSFVERVLLRTVLADRLLARYPLLLALSRSAKHAALGLAAAYLLLVLLIWAPLWVLSCLVTEGGVYFLLVVTAAHGGRCLLRLLAFPGTNVRVYGEIENEFARYSCRMLEGACGAADDCARSVIAGASASASAGSGVAAGAEHGGWGASDVPATRERLAVFRDRVLGAYWEVLHCLLEEGGCGGGCCPASSPKSGGDWGCGGNGFFQRLSGYSSACGDACRRNLCCAGSESAAGDAEGGIHTESAHSPRNGGGSTNTKKTRYGNNPLVGDVGNMRNLTAQARSDGRELYTILTSMLENITSLESDMLQLVDNGEWAKGAGLIAKEAGRRATDLILCAGKLREFVLRVKLPSPEGDGDSNGGDQGRQLRGGYGEAEVGVDAVRHRLECRGTATSSQSALGMMRSAAQAFANMIDPSPHNIIFGLDVIRGTFLLRYVGARQFWVPRVGGGRIDVVTIPSLASGGEGDASRESFLPLSPRKGRSDSDAVAPSCPGSGDTNSATGGRRRAVLYCNPNAGLAEVAAGMGLTGGNVGAGKGDEEEKEPTCWTEYYIELGYDVYLFNYAGYGRSYGGSSLNDVTSAEYSHGILGALRRVFFSTFMAFKPSSESLKSDAEAVARHLIDNIGVNELIIHGESIGGMAAAGAARKLTAKKKSTSSGPRTVLVCDRTFCNLEAVAQRLIGQWAGGAVRLLTPWWSTDVAGDYIASNCPKVVAQDCADEIIHDSSSLKAGLALAAELTRGSTSDVGWVMPTPVEYRVADMDGVGMTQSRLASVALSRLEAPPSWPSDGHMTWAEVLHFAACAKRIGKLATTARRQTRVNVGSEEGVEVAYSPDVSSVKSMLLNDAQDPEEKALIEIWNVLAHCDGLCGHPLGHSVKEGFDSTVSWLCSAIVFGGQVLAERAEKRWSRQALPLQAGTGDTNHTFLVEDFDSRPADYEWDEDDLIKHPVPIPEVLSSLKEINATANTLKEVELELNYVIGVLDYIISRLISRETIAITTGQRSGHADVHGAVSTGYFLNIHCGHNNQYSAKERKKLIALIRRCCCNPV